MGSSNSITNTRSKSSKPINNNNEKVFLPGNDFTFFAIIIITLALLIIPWIIYQYIPAVSASPGYTGESKCVYPYTYEILISAAVVLSVFNKLVSRRLIKGSSHWKVFLLFEAALLVSTAIVIFLNNVACTFNPIQF